MRPVFVPLLISVMVITAQGADAPTELDALRRQCAIDFTNAAPHLALARYYAVRGEKSLAFDIAESARLMIGDAEFDRAFAKADLVARNAAETQPTVSEKELGDEFKRLDAIREKQGLKALRQHIADELARNPRSCAPHVVQAGILADDGKIDDAGKSFAMAAELAPRSVAVHLAAGRFFLKVAKDNEKALDQYLSAYLLAPHCYDGEYAEFRIKKLLREAGKSRYESLRKSGRSAGDLLSSSDPATVAAALIDLRANAGSEHVDALVALMAHDDPILRWEATNLLMRVVDASFEARIRLLLKDSDLRRRGLAAYLAVRILKERSLDDMRAMLKDPASLLRYDAVSALSMHGGGAGRKLVDEYAESGIEKDPAIKVWLQSIRRGSGRGTSNVESAPRFEGAGQSSAAARSPGHSSGFDDPPYLKMFAKIPPTMAFAGIIGLAAGWILLPTFIANRRRTKHRVSIRRWAIGSLLFAVTGWMLLTPIAARQQESEAWELMGKGFIGSATLGFLLWTWTLVWALRDEPETPEAA